MRNEYDILSRKTTHFSIYFTACLWSVYPIISGLYKFGHLELGHTMIAYIVLDIVSKGGFTFVLIGSRELAARRQSFSASFTLRALRIKPLEICTEDAIGTSSVDDFCRQIESDSV
jgi:bacteriorhodopsin